MGKTTISENRFDANADGCPAVCHLIIMEGNTKGFIAGRSTTNKHGSKTIRFEQYHVHQSRPEEERRVKEETVNYTPTRAPFSSQQPGKGFNLPAAEARALMHVHATLVSRGKCTPAYRAFVIWYMIRFGGARHKKENYFNPDHAPNPEATGDRLYVNPFKVVADAERYYEDPPSSWYSGETWGVPSSTGLRTYTSQVRDYSRIRPKKIIGSATHDKTEPRVIVHMIGEDKMRRGISLNATAKRTKAVASFTHVRGKYNKQSFAGDAMVAFAKATVATRQDSFTGRVVHHEDYGALRRHQLSNPPLGWRWRELESVTDGVVRYTWLKETVPDDDPFWDDLNGNNGSATNTDDHDWPATPVWDARTQGWHGELVGMRNFWGPSLAMHFTVTTPRDVCTIRIPQGRKWPLAAFKVLLYRLMPSLERSAVVWRGLDDFDVEHREGNFDIVNMARVIAFVMPLTISPELPMFTNSLWELRADARWDHTPIVAIPGVRHSTVDPRTLGLRGGGVSDRKAKALRDDLAGMGLLNGAGGGGPSPVNYHLIAPSGQLEGNPSKKLQRSRAYLEDSQVEAEYLNELHTTDEELIKKFPAMDPGRLAQVHKHKKAPTPSPATTEPSSPEHTPKPLYGAAPAAASHARKVDRSLHAALSEAATELLAPINTPPKKPVEVVWCVDCPLSRAQQVYYNGTDVVRKPFAAFVQVGEVLADVVGHGPGWVTTCEGKGKPAIIAEGCLAYLSVPSYRYMQKVVPSFRELVFLPHLNLMRKANPLDNPGLKDIKAINRMANSNYAHADFLREVLADTMDYYIQSARYNSARADSPLENYIGGCGRTDDLYQTLPRDVRSVTGPTTGRASQVSHLNAELPYAWAENLRADMTLVGIRGCTLAPFEGSLLPVFDTEAPPTGHRTKYFSFNGSGQAPFIQYARSACNLRQGLKRVLSARAGEFWYRKQARKLAHRICDFSPQLTRPGQHRMLRRRSQRFMARFYSHPSVKAHANMTFAEAGEEYAHQVQSPLPFAVENDVVDPMFDFTATCMQEMVFDTGRSLIHKVCDSLMNSAHWAYYSGFDLLLTLGCNLWSREFCAQIPHVKKALRMAYVQGVKDFWSADVMVDRLNGAVKEELAKFKKAPRLFVTYEAGCMYANELPEFVKVCMNGERTFRTGSMSGTIHIFAKPKTAVLVQAFRSLIEATGIHDHMYALIFSDDVVYAGCRRTAGGGRQCFCFNGDIASNDSSQDACAFLSAFLLMSRFHEGSAFGLVEQCTKPMVFENPDHVKGTARESFTIECAVPFEGSGTILTTILNHCASFLISCNFLWLLGNQHSLSTADCYLAAAAFAGHCVTMDDCCTDGVVVPERIQFLKRSPMLGSGPDGVVDWWPVKNAGCVLRSFGTMSGDMQARHLGLDQPSFWALSDHDKAERFFAGVVAGDKNEPMCPIQAALRSRFPVGQPNPLRDMSAGDYVLETQDLQHITIDESSFMRRYGVREWELQLLTSCIDHIRVGSHTATTAAAAFYAVDYGVEPDSSPDVLALSIGGVCEV